MPWNLLSTKYHHPTVPAKCIPRPHLVRRLSEGLDADRQLTLLSAPPGFGKTTCISAWIDTLDFPVAWLSLDPSDDDPARFFSYFIAALQQVNDQIGGEIESVLSTGAPIAPESIATVIINDIQKLEGKVLFALDDFHVLQEPVILQFIERIIANQPRQLHIILITREDPALPLARLRASNKMTEIRAIDLRFTNSETGQFLQDVIDLPVSRKDIEVLEDRTEGWVAGLQLAGLSMRGRNDISSYIASFSGSHRHVINYLTEEVFNHQPEEIQSFLLQTSILDRLNGDLCDAVTQRADSSILLENLLNSNLFLVPLDDEQRWYRYHHLFADLLRTLLRRVRTGKDIENLHQRASQWYTGQGMIFEAVEHALAAQDYPLAVHLIELHALDIVSQGYVKTVERWSGALPPEWQSRSQRMNTALAETYLLRSNYKMAHHYLAQSEASVFAPESASVAELTPPEAQSLRAEWLALRANLYNIEGQAAESLATARRALQIAHPDDAYAQGLAYMAMGGAYRITDEYPNLVEAYQKAIHNSRQSGNSLSGILSATALVLAALKHGKLHYAEQIASSTARQADASGSPPPVAGPIFGTLGIIYHEWNRLTEARGLYQRALQMNQFSGHNSGLIFTHLCLARLEESEGDIAAAAREMQEALDLLPQGITAWLKPEVTLQQVRIGLAQGHLHEVEAVLNALGIDWRGPVLKELELYFLAYLHWMREKGRLKELSQEVKIADALVERSIHGERITIALQALLLRAQMHAQLNERSSALEDVSLALKLAESEGFIRTFVDAGPEIALLLKENLANRQRRDQPAAYIRQLLAAFSGNGRNAKDQGMIAQPPLIEALTEREMDVLRLITDGLEYKEIAERLVISLNTVRFYVKEIYSKLQVNNRSRAVETARKLGLL